MNFIMSNHCKARYTPIDVAPSATMPIIVHKKPLTALGLSLSLAPAINAPTVPFHNLANKKNQINMLVRKYNIATFIADFMPTNSIIGFTPL